MGVSNLGFRKKTALNLFWLKKKIDARLHELTYLFWECTLRCNLKCVHCGSDCQKNASVQDMPLGDFLRVIDSIKEQVNPHKTIIAITGGEPLMRKDLETCGRELTKREFPWGMVTNGYSLTSDRYRSLLDAGLRSITLSLDGLKGSHDWLRGKDGSFDRAYGAALMLAGTENLVYDVVTCINQRNFNEIPMIKKMLIEAGVKKWRLFTIFPKGRAARNPALQISDNQFKDLMEFIAVTRREGEIHTSYACSGFLGSYEREVRDHFFYCQAGINIGSVLIDGSISACPSLRSDFIQGNIYKDDFMTCWNDRFQVMRNRSWTKTGLCASCGVYRWCQGNGLHLRDEKSGELLKCHFDILRQAEKSS